MERLDPTERRIVGVLIEKALATPEYYPMTVNALVNGCNQKNNRDPQTSYQTFEVEGALRSLYVKKLATNTNAHGRSLKWLHRLDEVLGLERDELAILAELLLRGPQQTGELHKRAQRMCSAIASPEHAAQVLERLGQKEPPYVSCLGRRSGERAARWGHTLAPEDEVAEDASSAPITSSDPSPPPSSAPVSAPTAPPSSSDLEALEARVAALEEQMRRLRHYIDD